MVIGAGEIISKLCFLYLKKSFFWPKNSFLLFLYFCITSLQWCCVHSVRWNTSPLALYMILLNASWVVLPNRMVKQEYKQESAGCKTCRWMTDSSFNSGNSRKKLKNIYLIFGKLVRRVGLPSFVCGRLRKLVKFPGVPSFNLDSPSDSCNGRNSCNGQNGQDSQDGQDSQNSQNGQDAQNGQNGQNGQNYWNSLDGQNGQDG